MMEILDTDILVIGAGLSGLRAACAALESRPHLRVSVATLKKGPSGSSFANRNNALGIQVPLTEREKNDYVEEALALAKPGFVKPDLVEIMVEESGEAYEFLQGLEVRFKGADVEPLRFKGCFSSVERAFVFEDLHHFYESFSAMFRSLGGHFLTGLRAVSFLADDDGVHGALFVDESGNDIAVRAGAVIAALGGPAGMWKYNITGPAQSGYSYGMLERAGVKLGNAAFVQFMWADVKSGNFVPPGQLFRKENRLVYKAESFYFGSMTSSNHEEQFKQRNTHCPASWGLGDRDLDMTLASCRDEKGIVVMELGDGEWVEIAPMAHSGNGGALIDEFARTGVRGLYCCGECATGMHGADRIGGGMVLAGMVFGKRAGEHAANALGVAPSAGRVRELCEGLFLSSSCETGALAERMQADATLLCNYAACLKWKRELEGRVSGGTCDNEVLTALAIVRDLCHLEEMKSAASSRSSAI